MVISKGYEIPHQVRNDRVSVSFPRMRESQQVTRFRNKFGMTHGIPHQACLPVGRCGMTEQVCHSRCLSRFYREKRESQKVMRFRIKGGMTEWDCIPVAQDIILRLLCYEFTVFACCFFISAGEQINNLFYETCHSRECGNLCKFRDSETPKWDAFGKVRNDIRDSASSKG